MEELPVERLWRDSRLERIWDGTSEIQRHIIARSILRPLGRMTRDPAAQPEARLLRRPRGSPSSAVAMTRRSPRSSALSHGVRRARSGASIRSGRSLGGATLLRRLIAALPGVPDAAFLAVPRSQAVDTIAALAAAGCGGVVGFTAGFAELGAEGKALEAELVAAAGDMASGRPQLLRPSQLRRGRRPLALRLRRRALPSAARPSSARAVCSAPTSP